MIKKLFMVVLFFAQSIQILAGGFAPETLVKNVDGYAAIETLKNGFSVACCNNKGEPRYGHIVACKKDYACGVNIIFASGNVVCAENQQLYCTSKKGWIKADSLKPGDMLWSACHGSVEIVAIKKVEQEIVVHDLSVKQWHNFLVTEHELLAHNFAVAFTILSWGTGSVAWFEGMSLVGLAATAVYGLFEFVTGLPVTVHIASDGSVNGHTMSISPGNGQNNSNPCYCGCGLCDISCRCSCSCICASRKRGNGNTGEYTYKNGTYHDAEYHHPNSKGSSGGGKSPAPIDGQKALDNSIRVSLTSSRRVAICNDQFVILTATCESKSLFHGHVRDWAGLDHDARKILIKEKLVKSNGKIIKA